MMMPIILNGAHHVAEMLGYPRTAYWLFTIRGASMFLLPCVAAMIVWVTQTVTSAFHRLRSTGSGSGSSAPPTDPTNPNVDRKATIYSASGRKHDGEHLATMVSLQA